MKTIDKKEIQKTATTTKKKDRKEHGTEAIVKGWEQNDFVAHLI